MVAHDMDATSHLILVMSKVREAWELVQSQISSPNSPFSIKPIPLLEQECVVFWLLWLNPHVCVVVNDMDVTSNLISAHEQGSSSLGPGSKPDL